LSAAKEESFKVDIGLFAEGDIISLSPDLSVEHRFLHDKLTGANHALHARGEQALKLLQGSSNVGAWLTDLNALDLKPAQVAEIVHFINSIGGLSLNRATHVKAIVAYRQAMTLFRGTAPALWARRLPLNALGIATGTTLALGPALLAGVVTSFLLYGAGFGPAWVSTVGLVTAASLWLGIFAHEFAHMLVLRHSESRGAVLQQGMRLGILHGPLPVRAGISCALAGPLVGAATSLSLFGIAYLFTGLRAFWALAILGSALHLIGLLPISADGRSLRKFLLSRETA
jgi:hypothetical protein